MISEERKFTGEEARALVERVLTCPENIIYMLEKHGSHAVRMLNHGQLHLDFDDRNDTTWNADIINLLPLSRPVTATSWKGSLYIHSLYDETIDAGGRGTREVLELILKTYGDKSKLINPSRY